MHECERCGGLFLDHATLAGIVHDSERAGPGVGKPFERGSTKNAAEAVRYVKCPMCHERMNRVNFGKRSGVVVDVCRSHGTWFDAGELTRTVEWLASGGARTLPAERKVDETRVKQAQAIAQVAMMTESMREMDRYERQISLTRDLVDVIIDSFL